MQPCGDDSVAHRRDLQGPGSPVLLRDDHLPQTAGPVGAGAEPCAQPAELPADEDREATHGDAVVPWRPVIPPDVEPRLFEQVEVAEILET